MATRATYKFTKEAEVCAQIYIHWDGYPEGAASYLNKAAKLYRERNHNGERVLPPNATLLEAFVAANAEYVELVSMDFDGFTEAGCEFHYEIDVDYYTVKVVERDRKKSTAMPMLEFFTKFGKAIIGSDKWIVLETGFEQQCHNYYSVPDALEAANEALEKYIKTMSCLTPDDIKNPAYRQSVTDAARSVALAHSLALKLMRAGEPELMARIDAAISRFSVVEA